jgi:hypothetical protein
LRDAKQLKLVAALKKGDYSRYKQVSRRHFFKTLIE